ncbi:hypothetical protein BU107_13245 [Staphylococcus xylosus]|uniref:hypothetical protein n=1 Tax=Staphylococcus xylosus TaxID=1288 RepID=UPI000E67F323|nr:hypothetical protein [Staphylococcus xylosus]RIM84753.1 hypothetical protein BU107_13245 [Staphylococcus xylosus]
MTKNKHIDNHFKDESNPLHHEEYSVDNFDGIKVSAPGFKYLTPEEKLKVKKRLKEIFDNWSNIQSTYPW